MSNARKRRFKKRRKAPLLGRMVRRSLGMEQLCDECSRPYLSKPPAEPIETFPSGSALASVFLEHRFGRKQFHVQLSRTTATGQGIVQSQVFGDEHLEDVAKVAFMAWRYVREQQSKRLVSRR